jgi:eukaryotic translation initiation factor 2-alpha kinase 3
MFRSAADISSSDPESSSEEESDNDNLSKIHVDVNEPADPSVGFDELLLNDYDIPTPSRLGPENVLGGALDLDADGHASVMTSALLEFFCLTRAADILNAQPGSYGQFTRESPEVKQLAKKTFRYKSQFLSNHGIVAGGIEDDDWDKIRQYYRDNLDMLGNAAVGDTNTGHPSGRHVDRGETNDIIRDNLATQSLIPTSKYYQAAIEPGPSNNDKWKIQKRNPAPPTYHGHSEGFLHLNNLLRTPQPSVSEQTGSMALVSTKVEHPFDRTSRYASEFFEVKLLGRGSFGQVFEAKHHVDGQSYAVKKIPLSKWRLEMLQQEGVQHLEHILKEIRTLARLEHKNVVRYFGAWVEERHVYPESEPLDQGEEVHMTVESSKRDDPGEEDQSFGIVFGLSSNDGEDDDHKHNNKSDSHSLDVGSWSNSRQRRDSRFTNASSLSKKSITISSGDEDEDVESIQRNFSIPKAGVLSHDYTSTWDHTDTDIFTDGMSDDKSKLQITRRDKLQQSQTVVLHIQMSLHPLTLSSLLNPRHGHYNNSPLVRHCFHLLPSLRILLGILSGVEYLHSKGIVHRDLKPANIFLSTREGDKDICHSCHGTNGERIACQYRPRIGDFGLVADISHCTEPQASDSVVAVQKGASPRRLRHVGTEFYCPPKPQYTSSQESSDSTINEKLDVFALGVILFELLYHLDTKMERQLVLSELTRRGLQDGIVRVPHDFEDKIECGRVMLANGMSVAKSLSACIKGMLEPDSQRRWGCKDVRKSLQEIVFLIQKEPFLRK